MSTYDHSNIDNIDMTSKTIHSNHNSNSVAEAVADLLHVRSVGAAHKLLAAISLV